MIKSRSGYFYVALLTLWLMLSLAGRAFAADWAAHFGGIIGNDARIKATATDASGNTYLTGYFDGTVLTLGSVTLTKIGRQDTFVAKLDASGTVLWAKNFGGSGAEAYGYGIAVDGPGNVYLGGSFQNANLTISRLPGPVTSLWSSPRTAPPMFLLWMATAMDWL